MKSAAWIPFLLVVSIVPCVGQAKQPNHAATPNRSDCFPKEGQGPLWLDRCQRAAWAGDGHAALKVALIYIEIDSPIRNDAASEKWAKIAEKAGDPEAPRLLGFLAMRRHAGASRDPAALEEAIAWYEKAIKVDPSPRGRADAMTQRDALLRLKKNPPPPPRP